MDFYCKTIGTRKFVRYITMSAMEGCPLIGVSLYTCKALRGVLTSIVQESQGLTILYAFVMLLLVMISLHMLNFRLIVAEFCPLVFLIHDTVLGEIKISST